MAYRGAQVTIPLGSVGLLTDDVLISLPMNSLNRAYNVEFESGRISKQKGSTRYNADDALDSDIVCLFDYYPTPTTQRLIAITDNGKIWRDTGDSTFSSVTPITTGLGSPTVNSQMITGGAESSGRDRKLFIQTAGNAQIQIIEGDASVTRDIFMPSQDWQTGDFPTFAIPYQNRMCVMGSAADRHRLYFSTVSDHENFTGINFPTSSWQLYSRIAATPNVDRTATIQAGTAVTIFTTTNNDGFLAYASQKFNKLTLTISQAQTGAPVYTYEYYNGSTWAALTTTAVPDYTTLASDTLEFNIPIDWNIGDGTEVGGSEDFYAIRALATTAPATAVQITSLTVTNTTFDSAPPTFAVFPGEGDGILCAAVYRGLLFVFKEPYGVYVLDGRDPDSDNWTIKAYSNAFGVSSPHAVVQILGDLVAANSIGSITSLQASDAFGDFEAGDILANAKVEEYIRNEFSFDGVPFTQAVWYPEKKTAIFTAMGNGSTTQDRMLMINTSTQNSRISLVNKDAPNCIAMRKDAQGILRPIYGTQDGYVYLMDRPTYNVNDEAYMGEFQTNYTDLSQADQSLAGKNKIFDFIEVGYIALDNSTFYCDIYIDGELRDTKAFDTFFGVELDSFVLDVDELAGDSLPNRNRLKLNSCTGNKISLRFYSNEDNGAFRIEKVILNFRVSAEQVYVNQIA
jgi:hypothetical protein